MKKLIYTFLTVSIIFFACKKENPTTGSSGGSGIIYGCTDSTALNYNQWATVDDGSCVYTTDPSTGSILGKWNLTQYEIDNEEGYYTNYPNGKVTTFDTNVIIIMPDTAWLAEAITWEFFNDQTMEELFIEDGDIDTGYYTWQKNGNTLALDTDWVLTINTLNNSNFSWTDDSGEDTSSFYEYYDSNTGYWEYGFGDTIYFNKHIGIASWQKISGLSPSTSNARLKQNNMKEPPFSRKFINRRKK